MLHFAKNEESAALRAVDLHATGEWALSAHHENMNEIASAVGSVQYNKELCSVRPRTGLFSPYGAENP